MCLARFNRKASLKLYDYAYACVVTDRQTYTYGGSYRYMLHESRSRLRKVKRGIRENAQNDEVHIHEF